MTGQKFEPTDAQIDKVLRQSGSDPRKLAIAYLRAQHRANQAQAAFNVQGGLTDALIAATDGDLRSAENILKKTSRRAKWAMSGGDWTE